MDQLNSSATLGAFRASLKFTIFSENVTENTSMDVSKVSSWDASPFISGYPNLINLSASLNPSIKSLSDGTEK
jgi:hypothetical protein